MKYADVVLEDQGGYRCWPPFSDFCPTKNTWTIIPDNPAEDIPTGKIFQAIKKRAKKQMKCSELHLETTACNSISSFYEGAKVQWTTICPPVPCKSVPQECCTQEEKENTMYLDPNGDLAVQQKIYFQGRVSSIFRDKVTDLRMDFGLVDDDAPETFEELIERIASGRYVISDEDKKKKSYCGEVLYMPTWRDPAKKRDEDGFDVAYAKLELAKIEANDQIMAGDAAAAKAAVDAFSAASFS